MNLETYIEALASPEPTPGGGSAATVAAAMGAALLAMVGRITMANPKFASVRADAERVAEHADTLRLDFLDARVRDEHAYRAVIDAQALPRTTPEQQAERTARIQFALSEAAEAPLAVTELIANAMGVAADAAALRNENLMSDVQCAVHFLRAAFDASVANVTVNHRYMKDGPAIERQGRQLDGTRPVARAYEDRASSFFS